MDTRAWFSEPPNKELDWLKDSCNDSRFILWASYLEIYIEYHNT